MKIYHYTSLLNIGAILGKNPGGTVGLTPRRTVGIHFSPRDNPRAIFGLLEPMPESWINNPDFPDTWEILKQNLQAQGEGGLLIEINVDPEKDQVFVGERGHLEGFLHKDKQGVPVELLRQNQAAAEEAFLGTKLPLAEYLVREQSGKGFSLPEVLIFNAIPPERITVSSQQPLLEESLARRRGEGREYLIYLINKGSAKKELLPWKLAYESKHGLLEKISRSRETI
jgi:hypothetical protein